MSEYQGKSQQNEFNSRQNGAQFDSISGMLLDFNTSKDYLSNPFLRYSQQRHMINQDKYIEMLLPTRQIQTNYKPKRAIRIIQCSTNKKLQVLRVVKGSKNETVQLNTNFKTIICKYLNELIYLKELSNEQVELIQQYKNEIPSFNALIKLFYNEKSKNIREKCFDYVSSSRIIKRILVCRANYINKRRMIKFIEVLRKNLRKNGYLHKWKSQYKNTFNTNK